jgi:pimeloyl-ACP methyl ester carboxylesterase
MHRLLIAAGVALVLASSAIEHPRAAVGKPGLTPVPCPQQEWQLSDSAFEPLPDARAFHGRYDGGLYRIEIPDNWNGDLVLFAHGFATNTGPNGSLLRVGVHRFREHIVKEGYAWAASSYRCNGYVPGQGLVDTMLLSDLFKQVNGGKAPGRTWLTGESMGGHITLLGMQEFPTAFAGGLAMCPAGPELFDYYAAMSAAAEVISGIQFHADTVQEDLSKINEAFGKPPHYTDKGRQMAAIEIAVSGGPRPFAIEGLTSRFAANYGTSMGALLGSTAPSNRAVDTAHIKYVVDDGLGITAEALNAKTRRKVGDPEMRGANGPYEEVIPFDGKFERPVMTMHGTGDLYVPIVLERSLKRAVKAAGTESLLTQRIYRIGAHCQFSQAEMTRAFDDLVAWVKTGQKPKGDDVDADLVDAGMTFTNPLRPNDPGGRTVVTAQHQQQ